MNDEITTLQPSNQTIDEAARASRRRLLAALATAPLTLGLAAFTGQEPAAAKKRHKKKGKHKKHKGGGGGKPGPDPDPDPESEEEILLGLINDHRATNGQGALARQGQLDEAAARHAQDEATHGFSEHTGSDGSSPNQRIADAGYTYDWWGENIYYDTSDGSAATAFDWWKNSPGHNANMLSANFEEIGIARAQSEATGYWYWVTDFASPA